MKHYEVKNLKLNLDLLLKYVVDQKITNSYLNYGLIRNNKILSKAVEVIEETIPQELKEIETKMYQEGLKEFSKMPEEERETLNNTLSEMEKNNKIFSLGFIAATDEEREKRNNLTKEYEEFLQLENDVKLYMIKLEGIADMDMELPYWNILDNFIVQ